MEEETCNATSNMEMNEGEDENKVENVQDRVNEDIDAIQMESVEEPKQDMVFNNIDEAIDYYTRYGRQKGFAVTKRSSTKIDGELTYMTIACNRSGKSVCTSKNALRPHPITKTDCKARINIALCDDRKWRASSVVLNHNHTLPPSKSRFYQCNRNLSPHMKKTQSSVVEASEHENLLLLEKDCRNLIDKERSLRLRDGDAVALHNYFKKVQVTDKNFFYSMDLNEELQLRNLFWADARCRAAYEEFGDVITFDTTYLTNKYGMPLVPFVGVNHHGQSILLGCGLISSEDTETFVWLFDTWLTCMSGRAPSAIITNQDRAMQNAIREVFPNARHRWCLWHIIKKLPEKLKGYKQYKPIKFALQNAVYDSLTPDNFEKNWNQMIENYELGKNEWLSELYSERHQWVPCFVKDIFWAGMSTTLQSETMHAFFDNYVNSKTTLKQFVEQYDIALRDKVQKENEADFNSYNSWIPCVTAYPVEKKLQEVYTTAKFKEFQVELTGKIYCDPCLLGSLGAISEYEVSEICFFEDTPKKVKFKVCFVKEEREEDCEVKCICHMFESRGILCRHAIAVLVKRDIYSMPSKYILSRWRKDIKRRHTKVNVTYSNWNRTDEGHRFETLCNAFTEVADLASDFEEKFNIVMNSIHDLKGEITMNNGVTGSSRPSLQVNSTEQIGKHDSKESWNILFPVVARNEGCPPCKRRQSKVEQIDKKTKQKKRIPEAEGNKTEIEDPPSTTYFGDLIGTPKRIHFMVESEQTVTKESAKASHDIIYGSLHFPTYILPSQATSYNFQCIPSTSFQQLYFYQKKQQQQKEHHSWKSDGHLLQGN